LGEKKARFALIEQKHLQAASAAVQRKGQELGNLAARLDSLSPLAVLNRGYSITQKEDGSIIRDAAQVAKGDKLKIKLANGKLDAEVLSSEP
jgi:exodeoxyribonuclease VII large subunit